MVLDHTKQRGDGSGNKIGPSMERVRERERESVDIDVMMPCADWRDGP